MKKKRDSKTEICNECGDSVKFGSGKFVNRIPDFNDLKTRKEMGKPSPEGDFICEECDLKIVKGCSISRPLYELQGFFVTTMNRLKFRAWDKHRKVMVTDFVIAPTSPTWSAHIIRETSPKLDNLITEYYKSKGDFLACNSYTVLDWSDYYGIYNYEIMQWTGLTDVNRVDIYEGDVVSASWGYTGRVTMKSIFYAESECMISDDIRVIGNVYQNTELLDETNT